MLSREELIFKINHAYLRDYERPESVPVADLMWLLKQVKDYLEHTPADGVWAKQYDDGTWAACRGNEVITPPTYPTAEAALAAAGVSVVDGQTKREKSP